MQKIASDREIRQKGFKALFRALGEADALRFLSQISAEKRDYLKLQENLFAGMTVDDIFKKAQANEKRKKISAR